MINEISVDEINSLSQGILIRYGVDFTCYEPKSLKRRIIRLLNNFGFNSIHELWVKMLHDPTFIYSFMNEISVGMTSMFRDPVVWKSLKERMSTDYRNGKPVSIWHSGCSTGEEVYTMGIMLKEAKILHKAKATATDINQQALAEAKAGVYHKIKMIENETNYKQYNSSGAFTDYYVTDGVNATMNPDLTKHVTFNYHNLITDPFLGTFDIIFCRNVMIYFDNSAKIKLLNKFYNALNPNGYFIIGFFDTMSHMMDGKQFELVDEAAKIFRKVE